MKMKLEFTASDTENSITQIASMTVHNEQSSISFGNHQLDIKTTFFKWEGGAKELDQIFAEVINPATQYHSFQSKPACS